MQWPKMTINKKLLPIKGHYFLFNAGTAPLVPYLSTYAKQLGFSSATVGLLYTILPISGLIAKPLFGILADRLKGHKLIFILFQIITIISFSAIYFIPGSASNLSVELDCGDGATMLRSCYQSADHIDQCKLTNLENTNTTAMCKMNCDMTSPKMWQTVCEHWHIPQYCYSNTDNIQYVSSISNVTAKEQCVYFGTDNVTLDGFTYKPGCRIGDGYVDINVPCNLNCTNQKMSSLIGASRPNMTCLDRMLNFRLCPSDTSQVTDIVIDTKDQCQASCELDESRPWELMEICEGWKADAANTCHPRTAVGKHFPQNLSFTGAVSLSSVIKEQECVYMKLKHIQLADGSIHYPNCISKAQYEIEAKLFHTSCEISCDSALANELFLAAQETKEESSVEHAKLFFFLMIVSWMGQAVVVTFADVICFSLLGTKMSQYGKQRLWGSVGWGIFSLITGSLIDLFSDGAYKNYAVAFILMFVFLCGDVIVSCFIKNKPSKMSMNILGEVGILFTSVPTLLFIVWTIAVGLCTGLLWNFLFWHLEDISGMTCDGSYYIKTLQGLIGAIQTFCGEIPFMFISGYILRKLGHVNMMSLVLFAFGVRFVLYSFLTNAWWALPIEILQGITFGMFYPTMTSYANVVAPRGTETTVQGLVGAIFEGVGTSLGSFIGGRLYHIYGGWNTFLWFGIGSLTASALHIIVQYALRTTRPHIGLPQGYSSIIRYGPSNDAVYILEDMVDGS